MTIVLLIAAAFAIAWYTPLPKPLDIIVYVFLALALLLWFTPVGPWRGGIW